MTPPRSSNSTKLKAAHLSLLTRSHRCEPSGFSARMNGAVSSEFDTQVGPPHGAWKQPANLPETTTSPRLDVETMVKSSGFGELRLIVQRVSIASERRAMNAPSTVYPFPTSSRE